MSTLRSLPDTVESTENYLGIYREDKELFRRGEDLYIAVLEGIEGMMEWIDHKAYSMTLSMR